MRELKETWEKKVKEETQVLKVNKELKVLKVLKEVKVREERLGHQDHWVKRASKVHLAFRATLAGLVRKEIRVSKEVTAFLEQRVKEAEMACKEKEDKLAQEDLEAKGAEEEVKGFLGRKVIPDNLVLLALLDFQEWMALLVLEVQLVKQVHRA